MEPRWTHKGYQNREKYEKVGLEISTDVDGLLEGGPSHGGAVSPQCWRTIGPNILIDTGIRIYICLLFSVEV